MGSCLMTAGLDGIEAVHIDAAQAPKRMPEMRHAFDVVAARAERNVDGFMRAHALSPCACRNDSMAQRTLSTISSGGPSTLSTVMSASA